MFVDASRSTQRSMAERFRLAGLTTSSAKHSRKPRFDGWKGGNPLSPRSARAWYLLLLVPFIALLLPIYLHWSPTLAGVPFFYWYQFALLFSSAVLTAIVYVVSRETPQ
jgi:hypothetical protein